MYVHVLVGILVSKSTVAQSARAIAQVPDPAPANFLLGRCAIVDLGSEGQLFRTTTNPTTTCCLPSYPIHFQLPQAPTSRNSTHEKKRYTASKVSFLLTDVASIRYVFMFFFTCDEGWPRCPAATYPASPAF